MDQKVRRLVGEEVQRSAKSEHTGACSLRSVVVSQPKKRRRGVRMEYKRLRRFKIGMRFV